jgi:hypothetical protein
LPYSHDDLASGRISRAINRNISVEDSGALHRVALDFDQTVAAGFATKRSCRQILPSS